MPKSKSEKKQVVKNEAPPDKGKTGMPYESFLSLVVEKLKNEAFIFVIAIGAIVIGLVAVAVNLGSPDLRFIIVIIAALAVVVILGYYAITIGKMWFAWKNKSTRPNPGFIPFWKCSACGHENRWENYYCNNCNHKFKKSADEKLWKCTKCNTINKWNNDNCDNCGKYSEDSP